MRVLITGASGLLGSAVSARLGAAGHVCVPLSRGGPGPRWDSLDQPDTRAALEGLDAVVHLAGESIAGGRWDAARKRRILDSRTRLTSALSTALAGQGRRPRVLVSASAVGYYGDRGDEVLTEASPGGTGFLAGVCRAWEDATAPAERAGVRVVRARFGLVLSERGGLLERLRPLFAAGLGGVLGSGRQYMSWITLRDAAEVVARAVDDDRLSGPLLAVAPSPATNGEFTRALARAVGRWVGPPVPVLALRLAFGGEMARELLLASARATPAKLLEAGHVFTDVELEPALRKLVRG